MTAYYNENNPDVAEWLRNLSTEGLIAQGHVDERSIVDVRPSDLDGYTQCHFFAGIGGWSLALRLAGWPDDRHCWTGSCPCQSLSVAGKRKGHADKRHLWPAFYRLIAKCKPATVFGEQSASKDGREWLSAVRADFEAAGYACGAANLSAECVGAPHERQRLYFVADRGGRQQRDALSWRLSCDGEVERLVADHLGTINNGRRNKTRGRIECAKEMEEARSTPDSDEARRTHGQVESRIRQAEIALDRCAFVEAWQGWNSGFGGFGRLDDGVSKSVAKSVVGGLGNAIVPKAAAAFVSAASEAILEAGGST